MQDNRKKTAARSATGGLGTLEIHDNARTVAGRTLKSSGLSLVTIDDDIAADIIKRMVPAVEHALHIRG